jgi:hypothetical protein
MRVIIYLLIDLYEKSACFSSAYSPTIDALLLQSFKQAHCTSSALLEHFHLCYTLYPFSSSFIKKTFLA